MTTNVITYQLAYLTHVQVNLCEACVASDDHGLGVVGSVQHGSHAGECDGCARKAAGRLARQLYRDDLSRVPQGVPLQRDGRKAYNAWERSSRDAGDRDTLDALYGVDAELFVAAWNELAAQPDCGHANKDYDRLEGTWRCRNCGEAGEGRGARG
jgi:hypothetical protein